MSRLRTAAQVQTAFSQALALHQQGKLEQARAIYEDILASHPDHADTLHLRGVIAHQTGDHPLAVELISRAIEIRPDVPTFYANVAAALAAIQLLDHALACYDKAIALSPEYAEAFYNRGNVLKELRRHEEALASYDRAIALQPDHVAAYNNRGLTLAELKRLDAAAASFRRAIELHPDYADACNNLGNTFRELKRLEEAADCYDKALALNPDYEFAFGAALSTRMMMCDWRNLDESLRQLEAGIRASHKVCVPFPVLALVDSPELHRQAARIYADAKYPRHGLLGEFEKLPRRNKIRIGYFSADFHNHATAYLMAELFEAHDRTRFELFGFSFGPDKNDEMRQRVSAAFEHFIDVRDRSDLEVAAQARALGIDIAVDLKGYTQDARPGIFAAGCAPIQASYLGYPGTLAAPFMDYVIADPVVIPAEHREDYTEKVVHLPHCYQVNDSARVISSRIFSRKEQGLPEAGFVFCCFNNNYKILPATFAGWMRILQAVEGSVLWLFEDNPQVVGNLRREAEARGVEGKRLIFARRLPLDEHLARHRLADLFIDTFPCNAHTTASDALWAGLPVLTRPGKSFASRVAASLLTTIGLPELITETQEQFEARAIELATHSESLCQIKQLLEKQRVESPLFDAVAFSGHLEAGFEAMYERHHAGLPPASISLPE